MKVLLIRGIVGTEILIEAYAYECVANNYALSEAGDLGVHVRNWEVRIFFLHTLKSLSQIHLNVTHVGILAMNLLQEKLHCGVKIEITQALFYICLLHMSDVQHVLYEQLCLLGVLGVHLLQRRIAAERHILVQNAVESVHTHLFLYMSVVTAPDEGRQKESKERKKMPCAHDNRIVLLNPLQN